jgi:hypothetical protein
MSEGDRLSYFTLQHWCFPCLVATASATYIHATGRLVAHQVRHSFTPLPQTAAHIHNAQNPSGVCAPTRCAKLMAKPQRRRRQRTDFSPVMFALAA